MDGTPVVSPFHALNINGENLRKWGRSRDIDGELPDRSPTMLCKACTVAVTMRKTSAVS